MSEPSESKFINIKAAAKMLGVSPLTLRNWDKQKKLIAFRHPFNNYRVYKVVDIEQFLDKIENTNKPKRLKIEILGDENNESDLSAEDEFKI